MGISEVNYGPTAFGTSRLQQNTIVTGRQRPALGREFDRKIIRRRCHPATNEFDVMGVFQRLIGFFADADKQRGAGIVGGRTAILGVDVQYHHVAPLLGAIERRADAGKRIVGQREDLTLQRARNDAAEFESIAAPAAGPTHAMHANSKAASRCCACGNIARLRPNERGFHGLRM